MVKARHKIAKVTWLDATKRDDTFHHPFEIGVTRECVGWILQDDEEGVIVALDDSGPEYGYEYAIGIPRDYVKSVEYLGRVKK